MPEVSFAGIVHGEAEFAAASQVLHSEWHAPGKECSQFQRELAAYMGSRRCIVVNSGSSANLLSLAMLNLPTDSKVLSCGGGFPATLSPILHLRLRPMLVDLDLITHNADLNQIESALRQDKDIRAILVAHTLGLPLDLNRLQQLCESYNAFLIEDCCEAVGSRWTGRTVGSFGVAATWSLYPSHQMNALGAGGAIFVNTEESADDIQSLRDWGKVPVLEGDRATALQYIVDDIPYDAQYTYRTMGYNMRLPEVCCAYGRIQLQRLETFNAIRRRNYRYLQERLADLPFHFPVWPQSADPAFFAFPLTLREAGYRDGLVKHLESFGIRTRLFFAGNITRHRPFAALKKPLPVADYLMRNSLLVGCWHGLTEAQLDHTVAAIKRFFE
jgi:CDP-6-deoxy-D-xylo-4-hexulose-3-dehydrase